MFAIAGPSDTGRPAAGGFASVGPCLRRRRRAQPCSDSWGRSFVEVVMGDSSPLPPLLWLGRYYAWYDRAAMRVIPFTGSTETTQLIFERRSGWTDTALPTPDTGRLPQVRGARRDPASALCWLPVAGGRLVGGHA